MKANSLLSVAFVGMALILLAQEGHGLRCHYGNKVDGYNEKYCKGEGVRGKKCSSFNTINACYKDESGAEGKNCGCALPKDVNKCVDGTCWCDTKDLCNEGGSLSKISTPVLLLASTIVLAIHLA